MVRLLHIGVALALTLAGAILIAGGLLVAALVWLGLPKSPLTLDTTNLLEIVKISLSVAAGVGGAVALVVAYRKQRLAEEENHRARQTARREDAKLYAERFDKATDKLGNDAPAVRLAGVHALAALADDWDGGRQMCIDVLCAYLRMPPEPEPDASDGAKHATWQAMREVRATVIRLIAAHLRVTTPVSWCGSDLDFTGVVFDDGANFSFAVFSGGTVLFDGAEFSGGTVSFDGATFSGSTVSFDGAKFSGGTVSFGAAGLDVPESGGVGFGLPEFPSWAAPGFGMPEFFVHEFVVPAFGMSGRSDRAKFSGGRVSFDGAKFSGSAVSFDGAEFSGGAVSFDGAEFSGSAVSFGRAAFSGGAVSFQAAAFSGGTVSFQAAKFSGSAVSFQAATFSGGTVSFYGAAFSGGIVWFGGAKFSGGTVSFLMAEFSDGTVSFGAEFSGGTVSFDGTTFSDGTVSFDGATFSGGTVSFHGAWWSSPPTGLPDQAPGLQLPDEPSG
ncbi:pentapeptide repeat-containing protein [Planotetraspora thailandica]|uniref:pentapeptide repeat-containing protein n=1 Tax=Planotetraspora thailandica TaxID=487172 RepID=UPI00194FDE7D|nr:pentapeptide repeat-containing protein [Planotetraspora thailandica]